MGAEEASPTIRPARLLSQSRRRRAEPFRAVRIVALRTEPVRGPGWSRPVGRGVACPHQRHRGRAPGAGLRIRSRVTRPGGPRILICRPDHVGDVLLTLPAVAALKAAFPAADIGLVLDASTADLARRCPDID